jgi:cytidine deaminase
MLNPEQKTDLLRAARDAASSAYCPFSKFHVGAAVLADGRVFQGCNVESASFGLTICAERVAIFNAISAGARQIDGLAVTCPDALDASPMNMKMPCGACRQVMAEFAKPDLVVIVDRVGEFTLSQILPSPFKL